MRRRCRRWRLDTTEQVAACGCARLLHGWILRRACYSTMSFAPSHSVWFGPLLGAWQLASGIEYQFGVKVIYTNPSLPFGVNAQERSSYIALQAMLSRRW